MQGSERKAGEGRWRRHTLRNGGTDCADAKLCKTVGLASREECKRHVRMNCGNCHARRGSAGALIPRQP
eukprot:5772039-Pleurochrysis_carterae.AAC.4